MSKKSYEEINAKIKQGKAVVVTAEEVIDIAREEGLKSAAAKVDVVTTGTFGMMCSSGAFLNFWHTKPKMRMQQVWLNNVPAYAGIAAVDAYIGATELMEGDPANTRHPGHFRYGGGHVIEDLIAGKELQLRATSYGTDCYPLKKLEKTLTIDDLRDAFIMSPRNSYQNYNVGVNCADKTVYTYMGLLKPNMGNINYSTAGQLSPLLNDPYFRTIGVGTRIFLGGGIGFVCGPGTQHDHSGQRTTGGLPMGGAGTLAVTGDMKKMNSRYIRGVSMLGYGVSLMVGIGVPIPILDEDMLEFTCVTDADILSPVCDYGIKYPTGEPPELGYVTVAELKSGEVNFAGKCIPTAPLSSYPMAKEIATALKRWVSEGSFLLSRPAVLLPTVEGYERGE
ncbi:MAG: homocysteine biosynthesis protein [Firmicutes bacterium]|nr:homocysteine biosynthesis protein [Bacillota bacterium]